MRFWYFAQMCKFTLKLCMHSYAVGLEIQLWSKSVYAHASCMQAEKTLASVQAGQSLDC